MTSTKPKVLLAMPLPPPYTGNETMTEMFLRSSLDEHFEIIHLDTSNRVDITRGRLDWVNVSRTTGHLVNLVKILVKERPAIANIPMPKNTAGFIKFGVFAVPCAWAGARVVSRSGGTHFDEFYQRAAPWLRVFIRWVLRHVSIVIVRAHWAREPFLEFLPDEQVRVVYIALDTNMFDGVIPQPHNAVTVLYVGHLSKAKGAIDLLEAMPLVLSSHPTARFCFAGNIKQQELNTTFIDGPDNMEAAIYRLKELPEVRHSIEFLGVIEGKNKLQILADSDIFVLPSYSEGFPFAVLEAMLAGKAVVATPVGALPEVFSNEEHLLFVEPGDTTGIAEAINRLIADESLRLRLGQTAQALVKNQFNLEVLTVQMRDVFCQALETNR